MTWSVFPREIFTTAGSEFTVSINWKDSNKKILLTSGQRVSVMLALHSKHFYVKYNWT